MTSAAFDEAPGEELRRILQEIVDRLEDDQEIVTHGGPTMLRDINGNTVGRLLIAPR